MSYPFRARFVYGIGGSEVDWTTTLPTRAWSRRRPTVGGSRTAAGGVPAAYVVRTDHILGLRVRIYEEEWADLEALVQWGQYGESFTYYPDAGGEAISDGRLVYLEAPLASVDLVPERDSEYPRVLEVPVELRSVDGLGWNLDYFAEPL